MVVLSGLRRIAGATVVIWLAAAASAMASPPTVTVTTPPSGVVYAAGLAAFGPQTYDVTAAVALVSDSGGVSPTDGCEAATNDLVGKIALVDRGNCVFSIKADNAQNAGAVGLIVADSSPGAGPPNLGGFSSTVNIPSVGVTQTTGTDLKTALGAGPEQLTCGTSPY